MGKINLDNYEAFFLDLMEDNLPEDDRRELAVFLNMHPELKAELEEDFGDVTLVPETTAFDSKESLKATEKSFPISADNIEDLIISHIEKQLNPEHDQLVLEYVHTNRLDRTLAAYEATILSAEKDVFNNKESIRSAVVSLLSTSINSETAEDYMISQHEGILSGVESLALEQYVRLNGLEKTFAAFGSTQLQADMTIVYADKAGLKKRAGLIIPLYARVASIAAVGLLILGLAFNWDAATGTTEGNESTTVAESGDINDGQLIEKEKPEGGISNRENSIAYEAIDKKDTPKNNGVGVVVDQQLVDNNNDGPKIIPIKNDSVLTPGIDLKDVKLIDDNIDIVEVPIKDIPKDTIKAIQIPEDDAIIVAAATQTEREEPLKVFTNLATNVFKRDVAFTRDKDVASEEYVAYGFKLGKFEFQRKKSRKL